MMETVVRIFLLFLLHQTFAGGLQEGHSEGCVPGFQVKQYQVAYRQTFQKGLPLLKVEFDDCAGNEDVAFEVSVANFHVDEDLNLVPMQDVTYSGPIMFIQGLSAHADDMARVTITGLPFESGHALEIIGLPHRLKRSLLVPPMTVTENQRAPFPRLLGKSHVISTEKSWDHIFRLTGPGADQDPKGLFTIDIDTGDVSVTRSLDREIIDSYQLEVSTTDLNGNLIDGPVILVISVIDQNDNRPIFKETRYTGEVLEGSPTATVSGFCADGSIAFPFVQLNNKTQRQTCLARDSTCYAIASQDRHVERLMSLTAYILS